MLEERFGKRTTYDYTVAVGEMIKEAKKMDKEFTLADLPTFADVNDSVFYACVRQVFTEEEIARYRAVPSSSILVKFAVNPETGQVWEVEYDIHFENNRTFLSIPIDKFHALENALKSHPVCSISEKLRQERQSYAITNCTLF